MNNYTFCILIILTVITTYLLYRAILGSIIYSRILINEDGLKPFRKERCETLNKYLELLVREKQKFDLYKIELGLDKVIEEDTTCFMIRDFQARITHLEFEGMRDVKDVKDKLDFVLSYLRGINLYEQECFKLEETIFTRWDANDYVRKHYNPVRDIYGYDTDVFVSFYPTITIKSKHGSAKLLVDHKVIENVIKYANAIGDYK